MPAREKLNAAFLQGSLLVAALVGAACESWMVFVGVLLALLACNFIAGDIRPTSRRR